MLLPSRFEDRDHSSMLPRLGKVMGAENRVEDTGEEGNRSLGKVLQGHVPVYRSGPEPC